MTSKMIWFIRQNYILWLMNSSTFNVQNSNWTRWKWFPNQKNSRTRMKLFLDIKHSLLFVIFVFVPLFGDKKKREEKRERERERERECVCVWVCVASVFVILQWDKTHLMSVTGRCHHLWDASSRLFTYDISHTLTHTHSYTQAHLYHRCLNTGKKH